MKKILITAALAAAMSVNAMAAGNVTVFSNGNEVADKGIIVEGRTLVPVRGVFEYMGYSVEWDADTKTATLTSSDNSTVISLTNGETVFKLNGEEITPDVPQQIVEGRFMLPLRAVGEALDAAVEWDADTKTAYVTKADEDTTDDTESKSDTAQKNSDTAQNSSSDNTDNGTEFAIPGVTITEIDPFSDENMTDIEIGVEEYY